MNLINLFKGPVQPSQKSKGLELPIKEIIKKTKVKIIVLNVLLRLFDVLVLNIMIV